jgi:hypothetical protein
MTALPLKDGAGGPQIGAFFHKQRSFFSGDGGGAGLRRGFLVRGKGITSSLFKWE